MSIGVMIQRATFFLPVTQSAFVLWCNSLHRLLHPTCCHFRDKTKQSANWLASGLYVPCDFIHYRCLGWRNRKRGKCWCVAHRCVWLCDFSASVLYVRRTTAFQRRHFVTFRDTVHTFSEVNTQDEHEWITRTRTSNCRKFSANFTDDAHELPSLQPEQLCTRSEVQL